MVIGNLEMAIVLIRAEFLAKSVQAGTLNKFSKAGLESQGPSVLSDHCNAETTQVFIVTCTYSHRKRCRQQHKPRMANFLVHRHSQMHDHVELFYFGPEDHGQAIG